jgi:hypothetical protein
VFHFQFRCEFVRYLLDSEVQRNPRGRKRSLVDNNKRLTEKHFPELIPAQPDAKVRNLTRKCVVCNTNVGINFKLNVINWNQIHCFEAVCTAPVYGNA